MRRWVRKIAILAALGAILNMGVAWTGAAFVDPLAKRTAERRGCAHDGAHYSHWFVLAMDFPIGQRVESYWVQKPSTWSLQFSRTPESILPRWAFFAQPPSAAGSTHARRMEATAHGWPALSLASIIQTDWVDDAAVQGKRSAQVWTWALRAGDFGQRGGSGQPRLMPIVPLVEGFAINTFGYGAAIWVVFALPLALRRCFRRRRGHCGQCNYDLRGGHHSVCPECGAPLPV